MENYSPTFTFKGDVRAAGAPQGASSLVRKQDVSSLSFISSIDSASSNYLAVDSDGKLSVSNLLISDVTVNSSETSLANYISNNSSEAGGLQEGDVLILSGASGGAETYIIHGADGSNSANYSQIQSGLTSAEVVQDYHIIQALVYFSLLSHNIPIQMLALHFQAVQAYHIIQVLDKYQAL